MEMQASNLSRTSSSIKLPCEDLLWSSIFGDNLSFFFQVVTAFKKQELIEFKTPLAIFQRFKEDYDPRLVSNGSMHVC